MRMNVEFMPGKRALAIGLCIYHSVASTILFQAPRFIPYSFGPFMEQWVALRSNHLPCALIGLQ
jgi:hypothetical protein